MKKVIVCVISLAIMLLAACQVNNVRDTGVGTVSPSLSVTVGAQEESGVSSNR